MAMVMTGRVVTGFDSWFLVISCGGDDGDDDGDCDDYYHCGNITLFGMSVFALPSNKRCEGWKSRAGGGEGWVGHMSSYNIHKHKEEQKYWLLAALGDVVKMEKVRWGCRDS